eukprot:Gb_27221 [translate_table: standard]
MIWDCLIPLYDLFPVSRAIYFWFLVYELMRAIKKSFYEDVTFGLLGFKNVGVMQLKGMVENGSLEINTEAPDLTLSLTDELFLRIFSRLPQNPYPCSLVCHRWLRLQGLLRHSIKLQDWVFLENGHMTSRFPNLTDVDLTRACMPAPKNSCILLTHNSLTISLGTESFERFIQEDHGLAPSSLDQGLKILAQGCPGLQKICLVDVRRPIKNSPAVDSNTEYVAHETGLACIANTCKMLQELQLHQCTDESLRSISACKNLQILRLVGSVDGLYHCAITDIGLTILARSCNRLVKLELSGCQGSYDGIAAIGQCCLMLEELTLSNHDLDEGWIAAMSFCSNLKTLRLQSCKHIDPNPGPVEHLGYCAALERLQLHRCNMRDKQGSAALLMVCETVRDLEIQDCWGLEDEIFSLAKNCRRVRCLSLEGCSLLTTGGLEAVVLAWKDFQRLRVVSCNNIRDTEITPSLASLFSVLKELKWRPDTKSVLAASLAGTGMGQKGGRFFKRV